MRALTAMLALSIGCAADTSCPDDDTCPTSATCQKIRAQHLQIQLGRDQVAAAGLPTTNLDVELAQIVNKHWDCFK